MIDAWESDEELGLSVDVPSLRRLPCIPVAQHASISVLPENIPNVFTRLAESHLFGDKLSSLLSRADAQALENSHLHPLPSREVNFALQPSDRHAMSSLQPCWRFLSAALLVQSYTISYLAQLTELYCRLYQCKAVYLTGWMPGLKQNQGYYSEWIPLIYLLRRCLNLNAIHSIACVFQGLQGTCISAWPLKRIYSQFSWPRSLQGDKIPCKQF